MVRNGEKKKRWFFACLYIGEFCAARIKFNRECAPRGGPSSCPAILSGHLKAPSPVRARVGRLAGVTVRRPLCVRLQKPESRAPPAGGRPDLVSGFPSLYRLAPGCCCRLAPSSQPSAGCCCRLAPSSQSQQAAAAARPFQLSPLQAAAAAVLNRTA